MARTWRRLGGGSEGEIGGETMGFGNRVRARDAVAAAAENHVQSDKTLA